jgi:lipopolysaccharide transport system permease protein
VRLGPLAIVGRAWQRRDVFWELFKREVSSRYSGSALGLLWSFVNPLLMLAVYTLAFREFLGMRWPQAADGADFSLMIFSGMIVHSLFSECLTRAPGVIVANANLVKKVVFPLALLPCVTVAAALFHGVLSMIALVLFAVFTRHSLHGGLLWLPLLYLPFAMLLSGLSWFMASLGTYFRDVSQLTGVISAMFMFLSPVFYPVQSLHFPYRQLVAYNPLTLIIEQTRGLLLLDGRLDWLALGGYSLIALLVMLAGYAWFQRTRDGFADVL